MSDSKFYVKGTVGGIEIRTPFTGTAYTTCAGCGAEIDVDIFSVMQGECEECGGGECPPVLEGDWNCDRCSQAILQAIGGEGPEKDTGGTVLPFHPK